MRSRCPQRVNCIPQKEAEDFTVADDAVHVRESSIIKATQLLLEHTGLIVERLRRLGVPAVPEDRDRSPHVGHPVKRQQHRELRALPRSPERSRPAGVPW